jgi:hypothetical protein
MKRLLLCLSFALSAAALSGCSHTYVMKLTNGQTITTNGKPKLKGATYYYKDAQGNEVRIPQSRVSVIGPASMMKDEQTQFKAPGK